MTVDWEAWDMVHRNRMLGLGSAMVAYREATGADT